MVTGVRISREDDVRIVDLDSFSESLNFRIVLVYQGEGNSSLRFIDSSLGKEVAFPWWEDPASDIRSWSMSNIPEGSVEAPYWDADQGWHIYIWRVEGSILIAQGGDTENWYENLLKVPIHQYRSEWERLIVSLSK
ncbi:hypothetical protein OHS58_05800 [Amycolatopsis sp. NBC_00348]|uniref:hypothetical protein n=1 Tax=Amycolatopsis sp. NBC_00348 TaxID=2975956 RepID=UPI002E270D65